MMFGRHHAPRSTTTYRATTREEETRRHDAARARQRAERDADWYRDVASVWWTR